MADADKLFFCRTALVLKMIDLGQYNRVIEVWEKDKGRDSGDILINLGLITDEQYAKIKAKQQECADVSSADEKTLDNAEKFSSGRDQDQEGAPEGLYSDHYTVRGLIGTGGVGRVFLGFDGNIEREVAIKELRVDPTSPSHENILARFIREAKITGQLEHPGIVPVYELGVKKDGAVFYVMKYVRGRTLFKAISECQLNTPEESFRERMKLIDNLIDVCESMGYAHAMGIIHRDLKPGNIILGEFGETILLDWGIARKVQCDYITIGEEYLQKEPSGDDLTRQGKLMGTLSYMAPEQADSKLGSVDQRSDVYALGSILFMLLTGERIYQGGKKEILEALVSDDPTPSPRDVISFIPPELAAICEKALKKRKEDRFNDATEMARELKAYRDGRLVSVYAYTKKELFKRFAQRNKAIIAAMTAAVLAIVIGSALAVNFGINAHNARKKAENALIDITALTTAGIELSRKAVYELDKYFEDLSTQMKGTAEKISNLDLNNKKSITPYLEKLHVMFPQLHSFQVIVPPGSIMATYPTAYASAIGADISDQEHIKWILENKNNNFSKIFRAVEGFEAMVFQVPIFKGLKMVGILSALIETGKMIPSVLSVDPLKSPYNVWCMQEDGYVLYDEDPTQIGQYLFSDGFYNTFPELFNFGKDMVKEEWGVGNYKYLDKQGRHIVHKIAVWDTFTPTDNVYWKVVISHPYLVAR